MLEGRAFTLYELKKAAIAVSGGYVSSWYVQIDNMYVWEVLEAIEIVTELKERSAPSDEVDIFDAYKR